MTEEFSAMQQVVEGHLAALEAAGTNARAARAAIGSLMDSMTTSGLLIAPNEAEPETVEIDRAGREMLGKVSVSLGDYIERTEGGGGGRALGEALRAKAFTDYFLEVVTRLGQETLGAPADPGTELEDPPVGDDGLEDPGDPNLAGGEGIRSPFVFFPPHGPCNEESFPLAVECGGCAVVVKEFRGLQLRLVRRRLTRAIEPWFQRRRIIHVWVWVFEWVPVQLIKTITVRCCGDKPETFVQKKLVLDRELTTFWRCH